MEQGWVEPCREIYSYITSLGKKILILYNIVEKYLLFNKEKDIVQAFDLLKVVKNEYFTTFQLATRIIYNAVQLKIQ